MDQHQVSEPAPARAIVSVIMDTGFWITLVLAMVALVVVSMVVEALRRKPTPPATLAWAPAIPIQYADVKGVRARYIKTGTGPNLVLLHTLRTQLDIFQKVIPRLAQEFTVYAWTTRGTAGLTSLGPTTRRTSSGASSPTSSMCSTSGTP